MGSYQDFLVVTIGQGISFEPLQLPTTFFFIPLFIKNVNTAFAYYSQIGKLVFELSQLPEFGPP